VRDSRRWRRCLQLRPRRNTLKFHANGTDATHTNLAGAQKLASLIVGEIKSQNLLLAQYLRP
jgi:hypothetical protein